MRFPRNHSPAGETLEAAAAMAMTVTTVTTRYDSSYAGEEHEDEAMERLLDPESRNGYFETEDRPTQDSRWGTAYIVANVLVLVCGFGAILGRYSSSRPLSCCLCASSLHAALAPFQTLQSPPLVRSHRTYLLSCLVSTNQGQAVLRAQHGRVPE